MPEDSIIVFTTFPDADTARRIAHTLIEEKLAACANLLSPVESIYRWKGAIESATEVLTLFKSNTWKYQPLEQRIRALHPYEIPEIVSVRIDAGLPGYLRWIDESLQG